MKENGIPMGRLGGAALARLCVNDFFQQDLFCPESDAIYFSHPFHLISFFQLFRYAFAGHHLLYLTERSSKRRDFFEYMSDFPDNTADPRLFWRGRRWTELLNQRGKILLSVPAKEMAAVRVFQG